jgi:predicted CoA-substrate-specific enzyme activase
VTQQLYLGVDVGSVSTNFALLGDDGAVYETLYLRTQGRPIETVQQGLADLGRLFADRDVRIAGVGTTGSARQLSAVLVGADSVKNEITAHAIAASMVIPGVKTVFEIGGQDSKIIILREGIVVDFAMNTVCAAGTGSFLDQQAARLGIPIEDFGGYALRADSPVRIAGRCTVFAESDMIHKQQMGHSTANIVAGLSEALVRNYLNNIARGKDLQPPMVFQGGVAANAGIKHAFEKALGQEVIIPEHHKVMGAIGAAQLARERIEVTGETNFKGFAASNFSYRTRGFECDYCPNVCEVVEILQDGRVISRWGDKCGRWQNLDVPSPVKQR